MCTYTITNKEIEKAELHILGKDNFNNEQKSFIKCLDSCCVQAYAGTGKTTSIVGKLHVLAQKNVWRNGRGICVISHTNVAVDEIKKYVAKHYPSIMQYPNFIGTIQEFINRFLFTPCLASQGLRIKFQDESRFVDYKKDLHNQTVIQRIDNKLRQLNFSKNSEAKNDFFERLKTMHIFSKGLYARKKYNGFTEYTDLKTATVSQDIIYSGFADLIKKKHNDGYFLFIESFVYGYEYLKQNPILKNIISQRFQFVFLDEAQDCSEIQLITLDELFNNSKVIFEQIGDINQAISEEKWKPAEGYLSLSQSKRFGNNLAESVNKFQFGNGSGVVGTGLDVKKYLITYDSGKEGEVLKKYAEILKTENIDTDKNFFAISHKHDQLKKYFPDYSEKLAKNKNKKRFYRFDSDIEYVNLLTRVVLQEKGANFISKVLLNLLYKHFKVGGNSHGQLKEYLRTSQKMGDFKKLVLDISMDILQNERITELDGLKNRLNTILGENNIDFTVGSQTIVQNNSNENKFFHDGVEINIGTVHSVKGQTHNATLFFSNREYNGKENLDIQWALKNAGVHAPYFRRLLYVSASRSKYLFAFVIEKSAYDTIADKTMFQDFNPITI